MKVSQVSQVLEPAEADGVPVHGTMQRYRHHGCRCDECKSVWHMWMLACQQFVASYWYDLGIPWNQHDPNDAPWSPDRYSFAEVESILNKADTTLAMARASRWGTHPHPAMAILGCGCSQCKEWRGHFLEERKRYHRWPSLPRCERADGSAPADDDHGTMQKYRAGCRCDECKTANRTYMREYRQRKAEEAKEADSDDD